MNDIKEMEKYAEIFKVLSNPARLCMVKGLMEKQCNVGTIQACLHISQANASQHLAKLKAAGIIKGERRGNEICYKVVDGLTVTIMNTIFGENSGGDRA